MVALRKDGDSWVVDFQWNGKHTQRSFKSKQLAERVHNLLEGWREIQRAKKFIKDAIVEGLMNPEQQSVMERYIDKKLCELTEGEKFQIRSILQEYKPLKKIITCLGCKELKDNYAKGLCKKCYMAEFEKKRVRV